MDDLITTAFGALLKSAPLTGAIVIILYLMRKEIGALMAAGHRDTDMEKMMGQQVEMFAKNLEYFERVEVGVSRMASSLENIDRNTFGVLDVQRRIEIETARQGGRK